MSINLTVFASLSTTLAAIVAPVIIAIINNRHQYRMKKLELSQSRKLDVVQRYVAACSSVIASPNVKNRQDYRQSYGEIFLYADKSHWRSIESLHNALEDGDIDGAEKKLSTVCQLLSDDVIC